MSDTEQTRVVAVLDDIFFASKIKEAAKQAGVDLEIVKGPTDIMESLSTSVPKLVIFDLNSKKLNPIALIKELKSSSRLNRVKTIGYLPHVEEELKIEAEDAGCDVVMPRSRFSRELTDILKK